MWSNLNSPFHQKIWKETEVETEKAQAHSAFWIEYYWSEKMKATFPLIASMNLSICCTAENPEYSWYSAKRALCEAIVCLV